MRHADGTVIAGPGLSREDAAAARDMSDRYVRFYNACAARFAEEFPDKLPGFHAYGGVRNAPAQERPGRCERSARSRRSAGHPPRSGEWTELHLRVAVPRAATRMVAMPGIDGAQLGGGGAWFDDLSVTRLDPEAAAEPPLMEGVRLDRLNSAGADDTSTLRSA